MIMNKVQEHLNMTVGTHGSNRGGRRLDLLSVLDERRNKQHGAFIETITNTIFGVMHCTPENFEAARASLVAAEEKYAHTESIIDKKAVDFYTSYINKLMSHVQDG